MIAVKTSNKTSEEHILPEKRRSFLAILPRLWPLFLALLITLFPFDWLSTAWPWFGEMFDRVFRTAHDHHVGHTTLFAIMGLLTLSFLPVLRLRPLIYFGLLIIVALVQEALQSIFGHRAPNAGDGLDLFYDLLGWIIAYVVVWIGYGIWRTWRSVRHS